MKRYLLCIFALISLGSCRLARSPKSGLVDGFYKQNTESGSRVVFVDTDEEILRIHPASKINGKIVTDTSSGAALFVGKELKNNPGRTVSLSKNTLDVDFLTMPLKYRPSQKDIPPQLNANLNGAVFLGFRTDKYDISYLTNPLKNSQRVINHYGFSCGIFTGFGNTTINPSNSQASLEYDGIVWNKGIAGIFAVNNFTLGLAVGFDNLLDGNRDSWVYESKPWFGFAFGLNLN